MGITYGDYLIDCGANDITPEQEREIEAREECNRRGLDPDDDAADGVSVWMVVDKELREQNRSDKDRIRELEQRLEERTTERDYHQRMADKLADRIRNIIGTETIDRAKAIVMHGRTTTYPSISSAEHVRNVIAELVVAIDPTYSR